MMDGIIYKATNIYDQKIYIGATINTVDDRKNDHLQKSANRTGQYFHEAIGTYGPDAFIWEQIDTADDIDELAQKEIKYIAEYNSFVEGYNGDRGGGFKKTIYQYSLADGLLIHKFDDLTSAANAVNATKKAISRACWSINNILQGFYWSYNYNEPFIPGHDSRKKAVLQYDLKGNFIEKYDSVSEASKNTGISKTCISRCCRGEREQSGGFLWNYS